MHTSSTVKTRRRGADLENAIIEVAWIELLERGYAALTMEAVAARACTSRSVLARRWDGKASLTVAAIRRQLAQHPLEVPDHGNVRTELLEYLDRVKDHAAMLCVIFSLFSDESFRETHASPQKLRQALSAGNENYLALILRRAVDRREIDPAKLVPSIETLLIDLIRHYVLMNRAAPPKDLRITWVDAIFLPLVRPD